MIISVEDSGLFEQPFLARLPKQDASFYAETEHDLRKKCEDYLDCRLMYATKGYEDVLIRNVKEYVFDGALECGSIYRVEAINHDGIRIRKEAAYGIEGAHEFSAWAIVEDDGTCELMW